VTQAEESVTQEKRRRHDVPALPNKKFFLGVLGVSAVNCALLHHQRLQIPMRRPARSLYWVPNPSDPQGNPHHSLEVKVRSDGDAAPPDVYPIPHPKGVVKAGAQLHTISN